jgi:ribosomal protein L21E
MVRRKPIRTRGKIKLSSYFQDLKSGDHVAIIREKSLTCNFPERLQGRTGTVTGKRGDSFIVTIKDQTKPKEHIVHPIHLKKIKQIEKQNDKE